MNRAIKITLIIAIALITGCYYDNEERLYPDIYDPCGDTLVTFSKTVTTILHPCLSCHSNSVAVNDGGGVKLENHSDIRTYVNSGKLLGSIKHDPKYIPMPLGGGKLSDCEIKQIVIWIQDGTLNN